MIENLHNSTHIIQTLQSRLSMQGELEVINEGAEVWIASFSFAEPAGNDAISKIKQ